MLMGPSKSYKGLGVIFTQANEACQLLHKGIGPILNYLINIACLETLTLGVIFKELGACCQLR